MPPATQAQAPGQAPHQQQDDDGLLALIVAALAANTTAQALTKALSVPFKAAGIGGTALASAAALVLSGPRDIPLKGPPGPAVRWAVRHNLLRKASFFLNAARRTQQAIKAARSQDQPATAAIRTALAAEKTYLGQHVAASAQRVQAASAVDGMAAKHGDLLGWNTVKDSRTTAECYEAAGKNFHAARPPAIGFPGATHPNCRCYPGPPHPGAKVLP